MSKKEEPVQEPEQEPEPEQEQEQDSFKVFKKIESIIYLMYFPFNCLFNYGKKIIIMILQKEIIFINIYLEN